MGWGGVEFPHHLDVVPISIDGLTDHPLLPATVIIRGEEVCPAAICGSAQESPALYCIFWKPLASKNWISKNWAFSAIYWALSAIHWAFPSKAMAFPSIRRSDEWKSRCNFPPSGGKVATTAFNDEWASRLNGRSEKSGIDGWKGRCNLPPSSGKLHLPYFTMNGRSRKVGHRS